MSGRRSGLLAAVGERLAAIACSAVAAGVELRAALQEELAAVVTAAEPEGGQALQPEKIGASSSLLVTLAHRSAKQEDDKSKSQEELIPATAPAPQQREEAFALEAPSPIQQDMNQEMGMFVLETIMKNQEAMRSLMAELVQSMGAVEQRIRTIELEMGLITTFAQELSELGEDNWT